MALHYFIFADGSYLFNGDNCCLIRIPEEYQRNAGVTSGQPYLSDELSSQLEDAGFFRIKESGKKASSPTRITLNLVQSCNLACSYCYASAGTYHHSGVMSADVAERAVDWLVRSSESKRLHITFFGGEPLLGFDVLKHTIAYCHRLESLDNELAFSFAITTNGTLLDKSTVDYLLDEGVAVTVSIDGNELAHDSNRRFPSGEGSFNLIERNLKNFPEHAMPAGKATISGSNYDVLNDYLGIRELGFKSIPMTLAFDSLSDGDFDVLTRETARFVEFLARSASEGDLRQIKLASRTYSMLRRIHFGYKRDYLCGAGSSLRCVDVEGEIYPCHRLVAHGPQHVLGSVFDKSGCRASDIARVPRSCKECWACGLCVGGCPVNRLSVTGSTETPDTRFCKYQKLYITKLIELYTRLSPEAKRALFANSEQA